jgi:hypothetical protein
MVSSLVQGMDAREQFGFAQIDRIAFENGTHADLLTGGNLVAHIDLAGRVSAHQNDGQSRLPSRSREGCRAHGNFCANLRGQSLAINALCGHGKVECWGVELQRARRSWPWRGGVSGFICWHPGRS